MRLNTRSRQVHTSATLCCFVLPLWHLAYGLANAEFVCLFLPLGFQGCAATFCFVAVPTVPGTAALASLQCAVANGCWSSAGRGLQCLRSGLRCLFSLLSGIQALGFRDIAWPTTQP